MKAHIIYPEDTDRTAAELRPPIRILDLASTPRDVLLLNFYGTFLNERPKGYDEASHLGAISYLALARVSIQSCPLIFSKNHKAPKPGRLQLSILQRWERNHLP